MGVSQCKRLVPPAARKKESVSGLKNDLVKRGEVRGELNAFRSPERAGAEVRPVRPDDVFTGSVEPTFPALDLVDQHFLMVIVHTSFGLSPTHVKRRGGMFKWRWN